MKIFSPWFLLAFVVSALVIGIPYFQLSYSEVSLPTSLYGAGLAVVVIAAALVRSMGKARFLVSLLLGLAAPVVVIARVAVDTAADPTSHNLWPFEVFIAAFVGIAASCLGTLIGSVPAFLGRTK